WPRWPSDVAAEGARPCQLEGAQRSSAAKKTEAATLAASFFEGACRAYSAGALTGADVWAAPSSFLKRWNSVAAIGPLMLCQTLKMALGTAARGEKCTEASAAPKPAFCMPTSIESVLRCATLKPHSFA